MTAKMQKRIPNPNLVLRNSRKPAEIVASIDDLLIEILVKLPIKHLIRFKLVSRHWLSLITSHGFCLKHNPTPNPAIGVFLAIDDDRRYWYEYIRLHPGNPCSHRLPSFNLGFNTDSKTEIIHSCNGLLLCCSSKFWCKFHRVLSLPDYSIHVYNPTTNFSVALPKSQNGYRLGAALVFDPVKSPHFKVVLVVIIIDFTYQIQIYSSETRAWISGGEIPTKWYWYEKTFETGVYWSGSIHWLNKELYKQNSKISLRFHVDTKMLHEMPTPPILRESRYLENYYFGESCDHLHFVEPILPVFNIYEMKRDYSEWFVKYKVDLSLFCAHHPELFNNGFRHEIRVFSLIRDENGKNTKLVLRIPKRIIKVNLPDGTYEAPVLREFGNDIPYIAMYSYDGKYSYCGEKAVDYIQSLCSV